MRMSLRDIGDILKENKEREKQKSIYHNVDKGGDKDNGGKEDQQHQSIAVLELSDKQKAAKAYEFYNKGKTPVQVATKLCLFAKEAITYYLDFWKLKRQYQLYQIYPEIQHSLPSFLKLHKALKKHGLNTKNVDYFVHLVEIGAIKISEIEEYYESLKSDNEKLYNQNQSLMYANQELDRDIEYKKRRFENDSQAMQRQIADLSEVEDDIQRSVDALAEKMSKLYNKKQKLEEFVDKFRNTNKKHLKIKSVAEEHVNKLLTQTKQDKKALLSVALQSVILALKESPDRYNIIFSNNNNYNNNNNEYEEG